MMKREAGFSLIELLIVLVLIGFVLAAVSNSFVGLLRNFKQQSKIAETNIEGIIGLEMLRRDMESAGYGLPWVLPSGMVYNEAANATAAFYNDAPNAPPRAVLCGDNVAPGTLGIVNGSDYMVLKATNLATNDASAKWTYLLTDGTTTNWNTSGKENFTVLGTERVIVLSPGTNINNSRTLIPNGVNFFTTKGNPAAFADPSETRIIYGVDDTYDLRMPFNRADYYVTTTGVSKPGRCAPITGTLVKAVVNQSNGLISNGNTFPLLDCVADVQVVTILATAGTGTIQSDGLGGVYAASALTVRDQLKQIQVYILAHEGQRDTSYKVTYPGNLYHVGPGVVGSVGGRDFDLSTITNYQNYRWKLYTLIVRPNNLR